MLHSLVSGHGFVHCPRNCRRWSCGSISASLNFTEQFPVLLTEAGPSCLGYSNPSRNAKCCFRKPVRLQRCVSRGHLFVQGNASAEATSNGLHGVANGDGEYSCSLEKEAKEEETPTSDSVDVEGKTPSFSSSSPVQGSSFEITGLIPRVGFLITAGHFSAAAVALVLVDFHISRISSKSLGPLFLTLPFLLSAVVSAAVGYFFVPVLKHFKAAQIFRIEGPAAHLSKIGTPTMGGLFFIPIGLTMAGLFTGFNSIEIQGMVMVTLAFAGIGLIDDSLAFWRKHNYGLPGEIKFVLQVVVGTIFFVWLEFANLPSPYKMKNLVWLPAPFGPVHIGKWYLPLTAFCCTAMSNGLNLTDGLDGLAGGTAATAFIGMSVALLPSFPTVGIFGSSMAGACFGFLLHNRHKAKVFMGDTGSLALGGALAAMACCSGMFLPLFIASGVFVLETISVIGQVFYFKLTKRMYGEGRRWLLMAPYHHHLEMLGIQEPVIISTAYVVSIALSFLAAQMVLTLQ